jgi:hypothetical protein
LLANVIQRRAHRIVPAVGAAQPSVKQRYGREEVSGIFRLLTACKCPLSQRFRTPGVIIPESEI